MLFRKERNALTIYIHPRTIAVIASLALLLLSGMDLGKLTQAVGWLVTITRMFNSH